ncbi:MAG: nucleotidyltransferase domain-containing protein [Candidatus Woesearchaeota archaeon]
MNLNHITKIVLQENNTNNIKQEKQKINNLLKKIQELLKKNKIDAKPLLGGSAAKETFLGNDFDVDIFILFNYNKYKDDDISKILYKCIKSLKPKKVHGSRDYYQIEKRYEIIPVLNIKNPKQAINITDASPLHAAWVKKHIKKKPKLKDEIKLTKIFFKSIGVYGAESYIKGISGHVTEILVIYYGNFKNLVQKIAKWKNNTEIDIEKHKTVLDKAKIGPLIVVDPIQQNRNAAAAVNQATYDLLKKKCKEFIKKPSIKFFNKKTWNLNKINKEYNLILKIEVPNGKIDIIGAKLLKSHEYIARELKLFNIIKQGWFWDKNKECYFYYKTEKNKLPNYFTQEGPTKDMKEHLIKFKKKYGTIKIVKGKATAKIKRSRVKLEEEVKYIKNSDYLKNKIKGLTIL